MPKHTKPVMYDNEECFNLPKKNEEDKKVNPKKVFKGYTAPKGRKGSKDKKDSKKSY
jgi:hypothetical protein